MTHEMNQFLTKKDLYCALMTEIRIYQYRNCYYE